MERAVCVVMSGDVDYFLDVQIYNDDVCTVAEVLTVSGIEPGCYYFHVPVEAAQAFNETELADGWDYDLEIMSRLAREFKAVAVDDWRRFENPSEDMLSLSCMTISQD